MKIELSQIAVVTIAREIGVSAAQIVSRHLAELEETGLLAEIKADTSPDASAKVLVYLERTKRGTYPGSEEPDVLWVKVESEYVRRNLGIAPLIMRAARDKLEAIGEIVVDRKSHRPIIIRHVKD